MSKECPTCERDIPTTEENVAELRAGREDIKRLAGLISQRDRALALLRTVTRGGDGPFTEQVRALLDEVDAPPAAPRPKTTPVRE